MRFARGFTALLLTLLLGVSAVAPALSQDTAPSSATSTVSGELVRFVVEASGDTLSEDTASNVSTFQSEQSGAGDSHQHGPDSAQPNVTHEHSEHETILHGVRIGDATIPVVDENALLTDVPSGSTVTLRVAHDSSALTDTPAPPAANQQSEDAPITEDQAVELSENQPEGVTVTSLIESSPAANTTTSAPKGAHEVVVALPTRSAAVTSVPPSPSVARSLIAQAGTYWKDQTFGKMPGFNVVRVKSYTTALSRATLCDLSAISGVERVLQEAAQQTKFVKKQKRHLVVFTENCTGVVEDGAPVGIADLGASLNAGGVMVVNESTLSVLAHEFGHNFSLGHANLESLYSDNQLEYLALFSPMAGGIPDGFGTIPSLDIGFQHRLGVLPSGTLRTLVGSQTFDLVPVHKSKGRRGALFYLPNTGQRVYIEYRSGTDSESQAFYTSPLLEEYLPFLRFGAGVRVYSLTEDMGGANQRTTGTYAWLLTNELLSTTLRPGERIEHEPSGFKLRVVSATESGARVAISIPKSSMRMSAAASTARYGNTSNLKVTLNSLVPAGGKLTATHNGKVLGTTTVPAKRGKRTVTMKLAGRLPMGKQTVSVTFSESASAKNKTAKTTVKVSKATPAMTVSVRDPYLKYTPVADIKVASGKTPGGKVTVSLNGKKLKTVSLKQGAARVALPKTLKKGKHKLSVRYQGSSKHNAKTVTKGFTISAKVGKISGFRTGELAANPTKTYMDTFHVNHAAVIQRSVNGSWVTHARVSAGTHQFKFMLGDTKWAKFRIVIVGTSKVAGAHTKSVVLRPKVS